ncbi:MAG: nucleotide sugar dehydrogenase [Pseudomonadota bacterium]|nr:nucleotide sugar dehydrogenase [Pseudomonadota bacterium]
MKISVLGMGYVGLSNAIMLSVKHEVICHDIDQSKLESIKRRTSPIKDKLISEFFKNKKLKLKTSIKINCEISQSDFIIISTPTNFETSTNMFDTNSIDKILKKLSIMKSSSIIIIKSTLPVGYTAHVNNRFKNLKIYFSPEFLREGRALYDNLFPSRIIIGNKDKYSMKFVTIIRSVLQKRNIKTIYMSSTEAESVKLFSNSYLAARVAFFNELDSYCLGNNLDPKSIIVGVSSDPRIGEDYNNPSFGFGGYCLPKDTKQLHSSFGQIPDALIKSLTLSNLQRKQFIVSDILKHKAKNIGIYMLAMKKDSDNFRESSIIDIIRQLKKNGRNVFIHEPLIKDKKSIFGCPIVNNFDLFIKKTKLIVTNRASKKLNKVSNKVYTRDIFGEN